LMIVAGRTGGMGKASWDSGVPISVVVAPPYVPGIRMVLSFFKRGTDIGLTRRVADIVFEGRRTDVVLDKRSVEVEVDKRRMDIEFKKEE